MEKSKVTSAKIIWKKTEAGPQQHDHSSYRDHISLSPWVPHCAECLCQDFTAIEMKIYSVAVSNLYGKPFTKGREWGEALPTCSMEGKRNATLKSAGCQRETWSWEGLKSGPVPYELILVNLLHTSFLLPGPGGCKSLPPRGEQSAEHSHSRLSSNVIQHISTMIKKFFRSDLAVFLLTSHYYRFFQRGEDLCPCSKKGELKPVVPDLCIHHNYHWWSTHTAPNVLDIYV